MKKLEKVAVKYAYFIEYDENDKIFIARCAELPELAAHGDTQETALAELKMVVLESLRWLEEDKEELPQPLSLRKFSGEFRLRIPPEKHRKIAIEAQLQGVSMNQFIANKL